MQITSEEPNSTNVIASILNMDFLVQVQAGR